MRVENRCRCCGGSPVIDFFGLCRGCADALTRWMDGRRKQLLTRRKARR